MATDGTVLRFRALYAPAGLWLLGMSVLFHLTGSSVAANTASKSAAPDSSAYRSYHFVLLVKSNGSNKTDAATSNVSEELVILPADAGMLERSGGSAFELKPQPLPRHITSSLVKKYHSKRTSRKQHAQLVPATGVSTKHSKTVDPTLSTDALPGPSRGANKKQRYPKKATQAAVGKTKQLKDKVTIHRLNSKLATNHRQLSHDEADPVQYELVATSKSLHGQPRTVRKTSQKPDAEKQQRKPRYEVIGTFRDAHVSRARIRRQSTMMPKHSTARPSVAVR